jgi:DNA polymerase II large subunit
MSELYQQYTRNLKLQLEEIYQVGRKARKKGFDPKLDVECKIALDLADLVEGIVGPKKIAENIRKINGKVIREEIAFRIAKEIVIGNFGYMTPEEASEQAIRTALAILTEGLTAAPLQGVSQVKIKENKDKTRYLAIYFAGPIRSAGGTDQALTLVIGDYVRKLLKLDTYKPLKEEILRFIEEMRTYERSVGRFQYHVSDNELTYALQNLPVEVTGTESDPVEVSSFRNLERIETNCVRGGALRVVNDGIIGRASKVLTIIDKLEIQGWDWLKKFNKINKEKSSGFMDDVIAGRPIFSFPSRFGGFRLRYGRARNTGLTAVGIHPLSMRVLKNFLAIGTQIRLELPGKGGIVTPVDSIEPPIVLLKNGTVVRVTIKNFRTILTKIDKILFLGDILISFGDFLYNNYSLVPSSYVEEWWAKDLQRIVTQKYNGNIKQISELIGFSTKRLNLLLSKPYRIKPSFREALTLSTKLDLPLHPSFSFFWMHLSIEEFKVLYNWFCNVKIHEEKSIITKITGNNEKNIKELLEKICLPHKLLKDQILIEDEDASAFAISLGYNSIHELNVYDDKNVLSIITALSGIEIRDKAATFVGARMGRPEKAKRREMKPLVHTIFPVALSGGSKRDILTASKRKPIFVDIAKRKCPNCKTFTFTLKCHNCGSETLYEKICPRCNQTLDNIECPTCKVRSVNHQKQVINFKKLLKNACTKLNVQIPKLLKGVKGLTSVSKTPEIIEKGVLRAKSDLSVYKDGTIRFDSTNAPLTHFKPSEIGVPVKKLVQLGYSFDVCGAPLIDSEQIVELKIQDIILPLKGAKYFLRVSKFIDKILEKIYDVAPYYKVKGFEDLIGHLILGLAPHTSVGILGRIIGFADLSVCFAHPIWHSAKRRDCDGDEDALMLALDVFLNFSRDYLPAQIGGIMDAPLLMIPIIKTKDVQRQAHDIDVGNDYPLDFYEKTLMDNDLKKVSKNIDLISHRLGKKSQFEGFKFTTPVSDFTSGNSKSSYKEFRTMVEKLESQLELAEQIQSVDAKEVALKVLTTHFMRDIAGNLRAFSTQSFRCKKCNKKFRRIPISGKCNLCNGQLTLTVYRGGIEKYLKAANNLVERYHLQTYYSQRIHLVEREIQSLFCNGKIKQIRLSDFFG